MVPYQARLHYAYNPESSCGSHCNSSIAVEKHLTTSDTPNCSFAPTLKSFSVLAGLDETFLPSPPHPNLSIQKGNSRCRRKRGKARYKSREEGAERAKLPQLEDTGNWRQRLDEIVFEHAGSPTTEDRENASYSQRSANISSCFASHASRWLERSPPGLALPRGVTPNAPTNLKSSKSNKEAYRLSVLDIMSTSNGQVSATPLEKSHLAPLLRVLRSHDIMSGSRSISRSLQPPKIRVAPQVWKSLPGFSRSFPATKVVIPALNRGIASEDLSTSICLPKSALNSGLPALPIESLSERGSKAPSPIPLLTQELGLIYPFVYVEKDFAPPILTTILPGGQERGWYAEKFHHDVTTPLSCQRCSFPRLCHMSHFSATTAIPHHHGLTNSAFADLQFTVDWARCDNFTTYKSPTPLLETSSFFDSNQPGHSCKSFWAAGIAYFCRGLTNPALMDSLNEFRLLSADILPTCPQQNCKAKSKSSPFLASHVGHLGSRHNNAGTFPLEALPMPSGSVTNEFSKSSHAQQVDSIFANRNPHVRRRLYSGSSRPAKYPWSEKGFVTPPIDLAKISNSPAQKEPSASSKDPSEETEPGKEWICISRRNMQRAYFSVLPDVWHRWTRSTDSLQLLNSIPVIIEDSVHSAESNLGVFGLETMEDINDDPVFESDEDYEVVQLNAGEEEWEVVATLVAETSCYESDDESLGEAI